MKLERLGYRLRQFRDALAARPQPQDLAQARSLLSPEQMELFQKLQPSEQAHSLRLVRDLQIRLKDQALEHRQDLLVAALLHDVGKSRYPLSVWERAMIVLGSALAPSRMERWGREDLDGAALTWRRAFITAAQHPRWGAELAAQAGVSPLAAALIHQHQTPAPAVPTNEEEKLLLLLQSVDNNS